MITRLSKPFHQAIIFYCSHSNAISNYYADFKTQFFYIIVIQETRIRRKTCAPIKRSRALGTSPSMPHPILV